jgi:uncharacterized protein (TIGR02569 family)
MIALPDPEVLNAFGLDGSPESLIGGEGRSFRVGDAVLKVVDDAAEAIYAADTLIDLHPIGLRLPRPMRSLEELWIFQGWTAWTYVDGRHAPDRWPEVIAAGHRLHHLLRDHPYPTFLDQRSHQWTVGDRVAFDEAEVALPAPMERLVRQLCLQRRPLVEARPQLIHGDLTGNVLFHEDLPPAIIDFSPYYRPPGYASAIVAVDAVIWHDADPALVDLVVPEVDRYQLLLRALIFRMVSSGLFWRGQPAEVEREARTYERFVNALMETNA